MKRDFVYIEELQEHVGQRVTLKGWVTRKRSQGKIKFLVLRDGSGYLQCVAFVKDVTPQLFESIDGLTLENENLQRILDRLPLRVVSVGR